MTRHASPNQLMPAQTVSAPAYASSPTVATSGRSEYVIIGPSNAGKTTLLATLEHALAVAPSPGEPRFGLRMCRPSPYMLELQALARRAVLTGQLDLPATQQVHEAAFDLMEPFREAGVPSGLWDLLLRTWDHLTRRTPVGGTFRWLDGPGGLLLPHVGQPALAERGAEAELHAVLVEQLARASGLLLCIESVSKSSAEQLFLSLTQLLHDAERLARDAHGTPMLPCRRVAICLTKADLHFEQLAQERKEQGAAPCSPLDLLDVTPPIDGLRRMVWYPTIHDLTKALPRARFGLTWTSVYGFTDSGATNDVAVANGWRPFRASDPFAWLLGMTNTKTQVYSTRGLLRAMESR